MNKILGNKMIRIDKYPCFRHLFWSNPHGEVPLRNLVACVIERDEGINIGRVKRLFGIEIILDVYKKEFKANGINKPMIDRKLKIWSI